MSTQPTNLSPDDRERPVIHLTTPPAPTPPAPTPPVPSGDDRDRPTIQLR
ncbi:hypothetical protein ACIBCB_35700 [Streptomyces uncialis]